MSDYELTLHDVSVAYGRNRVITHLNLRAVPGRVYGLAGLNGAGKSTLFNAILGLVPHDGEVRIGGAVFQRQHLDLIGASVNGPAFYPQLSARRNLLVHARLTGTAPARIEQVLATVGLSAGATRAGSFSTGMKVRLSLALALLTNPPILILDEPQNGLDPQGIADLRVLVERLAAAGKTVVVSSHQLGEVEKMVDDLGVLHRGALVFQGPLAEFAPPGQSLEQAFFRAVGGAR